MDATKRSTSSTAWPDVTEAVRRVMRANSGKESAPERAVRSLVHAMGYRFKTHYARLPGKPDLVFTARQKAVWVHGCFWHSHGGCRFATVPRTRAQYWEPKLARNRERDAENVRRLREMGWGVACRLGV